MSSLRRGFQRLGFQKNIDRLLAESQDKAGLAKTLTARDLVTLGVAGIIGAGIFVLIGEGIAKAGVAVVPAFILAALICAVAGFAYAELAAAIPASGSAYAYIYTVLGELPGWMVAWALILEYAVGAIAVAVGWRNNLLALVNQAGRLSEGNPDLDYFETPLSYGLTHSPLESVTLPDGTSLNGWINVPSILIVLAVTALLVKGTKESAKFTAVLVAIKVAILLLAIGVGAMLFSTANFADPLPCYNTPSGIPCGAPGFNADAAVYDVTSAWGGIQAVFAAAAIMFFAYIGFDSVSTTAEETKNPKRDLPVGILGSLGITTFLYVLAALALVGAAHWTEFVGNSKAAHDAIGEPFGYVFEKAGMDWAAVLVRVGALIGLTSVLLVLILGGVRVFFNMSRDGLLPAWISKVGPRGNPAATTMFYGGFTVVFAGLLTLGAAVELVNIGTLFAFLMVVLAAWIFRIRRPDVERPFRMPLWNVVTANGRPYLPLFSLLGAAGIVALIFSLNEFTLWASLTWAGVGFLMYAVYGVRNSREADERIAQLTPRPPVKPVADLRKK
jgi:basic amino acid/polyamine antiporter, APA family